MYIELGRIGKSKFYIPENVRQIRIQGKKSRYQKYKQDTKLSEENFQ